MAIDFDGPLMVGCVKSHFLDSGSFTLWTKAAAYQKKTGRSQWEFYDSKEFWEYTDAYAEFVKKYKAGIDFYSNVDAIPNPEITWRNQKYLEKTHSLEPVPVVHFPTNLDWLRHYIGAGYQFIALGGLVGSAATDKARSWIDEAFDIVCDTPDRTPVVKIHGFGVTTYDLLLRYPWWSVDSTTWTKIAAFGGILVPHKRRGKFIFDEQPYLMKVSSEAPDRKARGRHVLTISQAEKAIIQEWLDFIGIPLGKMDRDGNVLEWGVLTRHTERRVANLYYFEKMLASLKPWPWPFISPRPRGFGLFQRAAK